jgi:signal-transduction protein with cAMP-binding, CBS, and nucleotidyltransferase domain
MDKIADFMISPVISIDAQSTVEGGAKLISEKNISSLLVKENEDYVGILTKTDIIKGVVASGLDPKTTKINSVMSKPLLTMDHYLSRSNANEFMLRKKIKHLVITEFGKVAGILTLKDMIVS